MAERKLSKKAALQKQLKGLVKSIEEEGLIFLIEQANTIIYNQEAIKASEIINSPGVSKSSGTTAKTTKKVLHIESDADKKNFIIVIGNVRKIVTRDEMRSFVNVINGGDTSNFFNYLIKERRDILADAGIKSSDNEALKELFKLIKSKFKIKKG